MSTDIPKPPVGSFGRRKAISRAESVASQESLQAAMDLEVAIGTTVQNNAHSSVEGTKPEQVHDLHAMCLLCPAYPVNALPDSDASEKNFALQDLGLCSQPPAANTNLASTSFLSSNSLAGGHASNLHSAVRLIRPSDRAPCFSRTSAPHGMACRKACTGGR